MDHKQLAALMKDFIDRTMDLYEHMDTHRVCPAAGPQIGERIKKQGIPRTGRPLAQVCRQMEEEILPAASLGQHPRSFACIPGPISLLSWMGEMMTGAWNPHGGSAANIPGPGAVEQELIRWMCGLAGYPESAGGLFVSGGSMANLTALTAARDACLPFEKRDKGVAYVSDQTHSSVSRAFHILGFQQEQIRRIPSDSSFAMDVKELERAVRRDLFLGLAPFAVVATAGTTNTGSIDPLAEIARLCKGSGLWMHVDGAFGASILLSGWGRGMLKGIEQSDSLSWDAHKWLRQTYGCSAVLVRQQSRLVRSFSSHPEYLEDLAGAPEETNFWDLGPELTRPCRGLKLWFTLQVLGQEQMAQDMEHSCRMAQAAAQELEKDPHWEIISGPSLGILNFRYVLPGLSPDELDRLNQQMAAQVTAGGFAQILTTRLKGVQAIRLCTLHPDTSPEDIRTTIRLLKESPALQKAQSRRPHPARNKSCAPVMSLQARPISAASMGRSSSPIHGL